MKRTATMLAVIGLTILLTSVLSFFAAPTLTTSAIPLAVPTFQAPYCATMSFGTFATPSGITTDTNVYEGALPVVPTPYGPNTLFYIVQPAYISGSTHDADNYWRILYRYIPTNAVLYELSTKDKCGTNSWCWTNPPDYLQISMLNQGAYGLYVQVKKVGNPSPLMIPAPYICMTAEY